MNIGKPRQLKSGHSILGAILITILVLSVLGVPVLAQEGKSQVKTNIVLVHGAWADGSSWSGVIKSLQAQGYNVIAPQFPLTSLKDDVARLRQVLTDLTGPTVVAGQSYGGEIMTALGKDAPNVVALVYICAWAPDTGESIQSLAKPFPLPTALAELRVDKQGFSYITQPNFLKDFAQDVDPVEANIMYAVQQPFATSVFGEAMGTPAWRTIPSWYLVSTNDRMIPPDLQRTFAKRMGATVVEVPSSHVPMVSHPKDVADLIVTAAQAVPVGK
jgi:pimeloyl-ACP methyl ester carboxylesterase